MIPRFRSFYGKVLIFVIAALCFLVYYKRFASDGGGFGDLSNANDLDNNEISKRNTEKLFERLNRGNLLANEEVDSKELLKQFEQVQNSPYEISVSLDLKKQEPGLGDDGRAVHLHGAAKKRGDAIYKKIALNEELSERLSYNRTIPDSRHPACLRMHYNIGSLPSVSVIIIFFNEPYSVLLRTIHSTLNTCNQRLLKEIILVDDSSTNIELDAKLDYYIKTHLPAGKIKLIRLKSRLGLIRARLAGAKVAVGDALIFLDAHCECNIGWCEPLLHRIKESRTNVLVPIIDVIDAKDFQYSTNGYKSFQVGGFQWSGHFDWINVPAREKQRQLRECPHIREICPAYSPTMAGGLFAIDRKYFWEIGSYDEQMDGWGGENLEMSFRIWQCGGKIETIPCSRVGHIFRDFHPYKFPNDRDTHGINTARMALVWMDDYINLFYLNRPDLKFHPDTGDITQRVALRKKLQCKSFEWYLNNIYPEKFIPTKNVYNYGRVKSLEGNLCLDDLLQNNEKPYNLGLFSCGKSLSKSQFFSYTEHRILRNELSCATVSSDSSPPYLVEMVPCMENDDFNEKWQFKKGLLMHINSGLCLDHQGLKSMDNAQVTQCDANSETQKWTFDLS